MDNSIKGRGANVDTPGRFARLHREEIDDGWWRDQEPAPATRPRGGSVMRVTSR